MEENINWNTCLHELIIKQARRHTHVSYVPAVPRIWAYSSTWWVLMMANYLYSIYVSNHVKHNDKEVNSYVFRVNILYKKKVRNDSISMQQTWTREFIYIGWPCVRIESRVICIFSTWWDIYLWKIKNMYISVMWKLRKW